MTKKGARRWVNVPLIESPSEALMGVRDELCALELRRVELLARRDSLVLTVRAGGATWRELERLSGCSRPALLKRGA